MALGFVLVCAIPAGREFFELATPTSEIVAAWAIGTAIGLTLLAVALRAVSAIERRARTASAASAG
jgi:hypothetical protein